MVDTESGPGEFSNATEEQRTLTKIQEQFTTDPYSFPTGETTLLQRDENALDKESQLELLRSLEKLKSKNSSQKIVDTASVAGLTATQINQSANTTEQKIQVIQDASKPEVKSATKAVFKNPDASSLLPTEINEASVQADSTLATVTHRLDSDVQRGPSSSTSPLVPIQQEAGEIVNSESIAVTGGGVAGQELQYVIEDSLIIVIPTAVVLIFLFLILAYRDLIDLLLGLATLGLTVLWTFGTLGWIGIPFSQVLLALPPLLLAVGIDFGIHAVNRYREEESTDISKSMSLAENQLLTAFTLVTLTAVIGFGSNVISGLKPIQEFGVATSIGLVSTFLLFGIFLPATKVKTDKIRKEYGYYKNRRAFDSLPGVTHVLSIGVNAGKKYSKTILVIVLLLSAGLAGFGASDIDTEFKQETFLPPEDTPTYLEILPEPFNPHEYSSTENSNYRDENFARTQGNSIIVYVQGDLSKARTLEDLNDIRSNPPEFVKSENGTAQTASILTIIEQQQRDPSYRELVSGLDANNNSIPDRDLESAYNPLYEQNSTGQAEGFMTDDYTATQLIYTAKPNATQTEIATESDKLADRYESPTRNASATGLQPLLKSISDIIAETLIRGLILAFVSTAILLIIAYWIISKRPILGLVNMVPIVLTVALVLSTMRILDVPFNALTGTILSIAVGIGVDYSVHIVHRFVDEVEEVETEEAVNRAVVGTGGALTGSMLTTVSGLGTLVLAITPLLGQFGVLIGATVFYAYLTSVLTLPAVLFTVDQYDLI